MSPTASTPTAPRPQVNDVAGPAPISDTNLVENIPIHTPDKVPAARDEDAELDKIMQDVGREMHKDVGTRQKHHFWELGRHHKKEANFSTQMSIKNAPQPAAAKPRPVPAPQPPAAPPKPLTPHAEAPSAHARVKPAAQKPAKRPKSPKPPKQHHAPVMVIVLTVLVTAALIAVAYHAYQ